MRRVSIERLRDHAEWSMRHEGGTPYLLPSLAREIDAESVSRYVMNYFRRRRRIAFAAARARDYAFHIHGSFELDVRRPEPHRVVAAIGRELDSISRYLSALLTRPRYGRRRQVGFVRAGTVRPVNLREVRRGRFEFEVKGVAVGRNDLFRFICGPKQVVVGEASGLPWWRRTFLLMPIRPNAREIEADEWYDFSPRTWRTKHPMIPLTDPVEVHFRPAGRPRRASPRYDELYRDGILRIGLIFGYDDETHYPAKIAKVVRRVLTGSRDETFRALDTATLSLDRQGRYSYRGAGLNFVPKPSPWERTELLRFDPLLLVRYRLESHELLVGTEHARVGHVFVAGGRGRLSMRKVPAGTRLQPGTWVERLIKAEVVLMNFDRSSKGVTLAELKDDFFWAFQKCDVVHYVGHANYGRGFRLGGRSQDTILLTDLAKYRQRFRRRYQIVSLAACHAAGYYADALYQELYPRKTPKNMDVLAAVNETDFADSVDATIQLICGFIQHGRRWRRDRPFSYDAILENMATRDKFHAYAGAFAARPED